jgi:hypothetical protein
MPPTNNFATNFFVAISFPWPSLFRAVTLRRMTNLGSPLQSIAIIALSSFALVCSHAETISLQPVADTTLLEVAPDNNLGGADFLNAGTSGNGSRNRALMRFDLSSIPAGSLITSATLSMDVVHQPSTGMAVSFFDLHRVLQPWGEGVQVPADPNSPGLGSPAAPGEATWNSRFAGSATWTVPGGQEGVDFSATASGTAFVQGLGDPVAFESTSELIADIRAWMDQPSQNFGWMLMTESENIQKTARGFASRESGFGPTLLIEFAPVPEPSAFALVGISLLLFAGFLRRSA